MGLEKSLHTSWRRAMPRSWCVPDEWTDLSRSRQSARVSAVISSVLFLVMSLTWQTASLLIKPFLSPLSFLHNLLLPASVSMQRLIVGRYYYDIPSFLLSIPCCLVILRASQSASVDRHCALLHDFKCRFFGIFS